MKLIIHLALCTSFLVSATQPSFAIGTAEKCVVLLHGLTRSSKAMKKLEQVLKSEGFEVFNLDYPSTQNTVEVLAQQAIAPAIKLCGDKQVQFVTHSMGGILVREYLAHNTPPNLGRVVMMGPPNQGSEVIDTLGGWPGFHWLNGDAGLQLGTSAKSLPFTLGRANFELGIIAGNRTINLILSAIIPGDDDGKVSVERTKLAGMRDHIVLPISHPFMMKNNEAIRQTIYFLNNGVFDHAIRK